MTRMMNFASACARRPWLAASSVGRGFMAAGCLWVAACLALAGPVRASGGNQDPALLCERSAQIAAEREGVPLSVLTAISLNESGRKRGAALRAWPWTVNLEGDGHWFDGGKAALDFAEKALAAGRKSFDVGCFQINYRWHGQHFGSVSEMFDPIANATYAAQFLKSLYAERGSWEAAAGAYHSLNPKFAGPYSQRFARFRADYLTQSGDGLPELDDAALVALVGDPGGPVAAAARGPNLFPLLQAGDGAAIASLVPLGNSRGVALFGAQGGERAE